MGSHLSKNKRSKAAAASTAAPVTSDKPVAASSSLVTTDAWLKAAAHRRTVYGLKGTSAVSDARVQEIVKKVLAFAPSAYNTQPVRITHLTGEKHKQFWDIVINTAEPIIKGMSEEAWAGMKGFCEGHKAAYGSVVFWESGKVQKAAAETHQSAAALFPQFGDHASGMSQILVWTALELEGLGANLQHMQALPPVEAALKEFCQVPADYSLKAHINYGDEAQPHPDVPQKFPTTETFNTV